MIKKQVIADVTVVNTVSEPVPVEGVPVSSATNTAVTVGSSSTPVLALNGNRKFVMLVNDSDEVIYLALGATATLNQGIRLNANGGALELNLTDLYTGAISGICASGSKNLCVVEG